MTIASTASLIFCFVLYVGCFSKGGELRDCACVLLHTVFFHRMGGAQSMKPLEFLCHDVNFTYVVRSQRLKLLVDENVTDFVKKASTASDLKKTKLVLRFFKKERGFGVSKNPWEEWTFNFDLAVSDGQVMHSDAARTNLTKSLVKSVSYVSKMCLEKWSHVPETSRSEPGYSDIMDMQFLPEEIFHFEITADKSATSVPLLRKFMGQMFSSA
eukprot:m.110211 g.110211  ORF g.110211 m.110211 type:complete len:213 (+) comp16978_c0_seq2:305-943(+)